MWLLVLFKLLNCILISFTFACRLGTLPKTQAAATAAAEEEEERAEHLTWYSKEAWQETLYRLSLSLSVCVCVCVQTADAGKNCAEKRSQLVVVSRRCANKILVGVDCDYRSMGVKGLKI